MWYLCGFECANVDSFSTNVKLFIVEHIFFIINIMRIFFSPRMNAQKLWLLFLFLLWISVENHNLLAQYNMVDCSTERMWAFVLKLHYMVFCVTDLFSITSLIYFRRLLLYLCFIYFGSGIWWGEKSVSALLWCTLGVLWKRPLKLVNWALNDRQTSSVNTHPGNPSKAQARRRPLRLHFYA